MPLFLQCTRIGVERQQQCTKSEEAFVHGILEGERAALSAVNAVKTLQPDVVLLGLGYLDREKINETFSREALLRTREMEPLDKIAGRDNGQFIPTIQYLMIHGLPFYNVGRDRLVEMGALGQQLLWRPLEFYSLANSMRPGLRKSG
ncbi:hypothetical protein ACSSS7_006555 [Eimeria intestinalis]